MPFNIACGRCRTCKEGETGVCLTVNPERPGGAYGYVDMGGWRGGQAEYVMVPYADWNLLKFPDKDRAMEKILDLTMLSDIFPTGYHGAYTAGVGPGLDGLRRRRRPGGSGGRVLGAVPGRRGGDRGRQAGRAPRAGPQLRLRDDRHSAEGEPGEQIEQILGVPEVDCAPSTPWASRRSGHGQDGGEAPATVLNSVMDITRAAGKIGIPGLYVTEDPGASDDAAKEGALSVRIGLGWAKSHTFFTGQTPVMKYNRGLMQAILNDRVQIADAVNATVITLDEAPKGYEDFDSGVAKKFVLNPHGLIAA